MKNSSYLGSVEIVGGINQNTHVRLSRELLTRPTPQTYEFPGLLSRTECEFFGICTGQDEIYVRHVCRTATLSRCHELQWRISMVIRSLALDGPSWYPNVMECQRRPRHALLARVYDKCYWLGMCCCKVCIDGILTAIETLGLARSHVLGTSSYLVSPAPKRSICLAG